MATIFWACATALRSASARLALAALRLSSLASLRSAVGTHSVHVLVAALFDHLVGRRLQRERNRKAERLHRLEIDHQLKLRRLQHRHFCRVRTFQNLSNLFPGLAVHPTDAWAIAQQSAHRSELTDEIRSLLVGAGEHRGRDGCAHTYLGTIGTSAFSASLLLSSAVEDLRAHTIPKAGARGLPSQFCKLCCAPIEIVHR